jgi:DNA-binding CsgD family transcriptional regulator
MVRDEDDERTSVAAFRLGPPSPREAVLTAGELFVLSRLRLGLNQAAIAEESGRSVHTVHTISQNIRCKFEARTIAELLDGVRLGVYTIREKAVPETPVFDLASALRVLERELTKAVAHGKMRTVRMHTLEMSSILSLAQAHSALTSRAPMSPKEGATVTDAVNALFETIKQERAALASAAANVLGAIDAERGTALSTDRLERIAESFAGTPFAIYGDARDEVIASFVSGYKAGRRRHERVSRSDHNHATRR